MTVAQDEIDLIVGGDDASRVASLLGPKLLPDSGVRILAWLPGATAARVEPEHTLLSSCPMERLHEAGLFEAVFPGARELFRYTLAVTRGTATTKEADPYAFPPMISDLDLLTVGEGTNEQAYEVLGAHPATVGGIPGVQFAVWAPHARWLSVIGSFNDWHIRRHPCRRRGEGGIWELFIPGVQVGDQYKFHIESQFDDYVVDKSDPFAFYAEVRPHTASIVVDVRNFTWTDEEWMARRGQSLGLDKPMAIYEVHAGSWRRAPDGSPLGYRDLAHGLVEYVTSMGYTHIELLPITEHPFDVSWGYQTTGYFAPTSRFGRPQDFVYFVDYCHRHNIGVFLDWVPSHFAKEGHGLGYFDGTHLYEHADPRQGEHLDWGTFVFNYGRGEVLTFLLSSAAYWLETYHIDGLRVDAVASMLYLDYLRLPGQWVANRYGGRENLEAVEFLRRLNVMVHGRFPGAVTMAEESTSWPMVSRPVYLGGLGFTLKWNMGWMHDTLVYFKADPVYRRHLHNSMTFSMLYNYSENFLLPLSHDEVVHAKSPLVYKAPGDQWQQFASLRLLLGYMWAHPGKKLLFMGSEFGQSFEWDYASQLRWDLLDYPLHQGAQRWTHDLNTLYRTHPEFYELDYDPAGFEWIDCKDVDNSILIMMRLGKPRPHPDASPVGDGVGAPGARDARPTGLSANEIARGWHHRLDGDGSRPFSIIACNFTPIVRHGYAIGMPRPGKYREVLNSDDRKYGGSGVINEGVFETRPWRVHEREQAILVTLPPLGVAILEQAPEQGRAT